MVVPVPLFVERVSPFRLALLWAKRPFLFSTVRFASQMYDYINPRNNIQLITAKSGKNYDLFQITSLSSHLLARTKNSCSAIKPNKANPTRIPAIIKTIFMKFQNYLVHPLAPSSIPVLLSRLKRLTI
jgi:hypothetical protein